MNTRLRNLAQASARSIDLSYPGDAYPSALTKNIIKDLTQEFSTIKWMGEDEAWDRAIKAVTKELTERYGVKP